MRDHRKEAVELSEHGWRLIPLHTVDGGRCDCNRAACPTPAKHPRITDWPKNASADFETVARWWTQWPHANIGVQTGAENGIVVLDIDPRNGGIETILELTQQHDLLPEGPRVATGGGGWHYYFKHPGGRILSHGIAPGVDIKGDGGQVVAPPSVHATGMSYTWEVDAGFDVALPPVPDWLLVMMQGEREDADFRTPGLPDQIGEGGRHGAMVRLAGYLRRWGMSQTEVFAGLAAANSERCNPPLDRTELATIAASAMRWEPEPEVPIQFSKKAQPKAAGAERAAQTYTLRALQQEVLPAPRMAVPGLLPEGLALLAGRLKMGKSWLMLGVGLAIAEGGIALGQYPVDDGDVLYVAFEDNKRRLQGRVKVLLEHAGVWPERMEVAPTGCWPRREEGGLTAIDAWLGQHPRARLVVVDTLQRFRGGGANGESDRNAYAADYDASSELQELALKHEVVIVAIHHYRKALSEADWVDQISGTNGIAGAADTLMGFERVRGERDAVLKVTGRDIDEAELALLFDPARYGWYVSGTAEEVRLTKEQAEFVEAMQAVGGGQPAHYKKIAEEMGKRWDAARNMARRLAKAGLVVSLGSGMYAARDPGVYVSPLSPQTQSDSAVDSILGDNPVCPPVSPNVPLDADVLDFEAQGDRGTTGGQVHLSPTFEAKTGQGDKGDTILRFRPARPCATCHKTAWSLRVGSRWLCDNCSPAVKREGA